MKSGAWPWIIGGAILLGGGKIVNTTNKREWIASLLPDLKTLEDEVGIKPEIAVSQILAESWGFLGASELALKFNNFFGITGESWAKENLPVAWLPTEEYSPKSPDKITFWTFPGKIIDAHGAVLSTAGDVINVRKAANGGSIVKVLRPFRAYSTPLAGLKDWARLLGSARYSEAFTAAKAGNLQGFAEGLVKGGWATDPKYAENIIKNDGSAYV